MTNPVLRTRLSETELAELVQIVQSAILNKEVKKTERGINMADEKYVISKASFEDFYETQDTLVSIMEKMVDRIEKQDQVIMKFGAALTEVMSKGFGNPEEMAVASQEEGLELEDDGADVMEEEVPMAEGELEEGVPVSPQEKLEQAQEELVQAQENVAQAEAEVKGEGVGVEGEMAGGVPVPGQEAGPPMMEEKMAAEKSAFEAGYKAALAEMQKKTGVEVTPLEVPTSAGSRPVVPAASPTMVKTLETLPEKDLANMTSAQINAWLRENKLYR
jgi:hypothetical protein